MIHDTVFTIPKPHCFQIKVAVQMESLAGDGDGAQIGDLVAQTFRQVRQLHSVTLENLRSTFSRQN